MFEELFYGVNPGDMILGIVFVGIFGILMWVLGRIRNFRDNRAIKAVISFCVSILTVYGLSRSSFDLEGLFYNLGIAGDILYNTFLIFLLITIVFSGVVKLKDGKRRWRLYRPLNLFGWTLLALSLFTNLIYQKGMGILIGAGLSIVGAYLWNRKRKWNVRNENEREWSQKKVEKYKQDYARRQAQRDEKRRKKKDNLGENKSRHKEGINYLVAHARKYKSEINSGSRGKNQNNWAYFINYLKGKNAGNSEAAICERLGITTREFSKIYRKYGRV